MQRRRGLRRKSHENSRSKCTRIGYRPRQSGKKQELENIKHMAKGQPKERMQISWMDHEEDAKEGPKKNGKRINKKREMANKKYGFGGKKKRMKTNDATSAADMSDFNPRFHGKGGGKAGGKKKKGKSRPGKNARRKSKSG
mmetsp:Transcript_4895/g.9299  ORF Transcript_4895/g.9299 Transcript_4895/m.9299 type:complete len:141 (-) Transcript_4895:316-738(-)